MTRAQMEAARERVWGVLDDRMTNGSAEWANLGSEDREALCSRLVTAVLGHPDGKVPRAKPGPESQRVAHLPRRTPR